MRLPSVLRSRFTRTCLAVALVASAPWTIACDRPHCGTSDDAPAFASAGAQRTYASPEDAVTDLLDALHANDVPAIRAVLGATDERFRESSDYDPDAHQGWLTLGDLMMEHVGRRCVVLRFGIAWRFPIPLVERGCRWSFRLPEAEPDCTVAANLPNVQIAEPRAEADDG